MALKLEEIGEDEFLKPFTKPNFDVGGHVASLLNTTSSALTQLSSSIALIDQQIHAIVSNHHGDLLAQTSNVELLESVVQDCNKRSVICLRTVDEVRQKMNELFSSWTQHVDQLERLYKVRQAMRRIKFVIDVDKIIGETSNTANVALYVVQIEYACQMTPKIDILEPYHHKATSLRHNIEKQTENILVQGLNAGSSGQVHSSIQIFANLNVLDSKVVKILSDVEKHIEKDVSVALEVKVQTGSTSAKGMPGKAMIPSTTKAIENVWSNLDGLCNKIVAHTAKVKILWKTLCNGRDSHSNVPFLDMIKNGESEWTRFWNNFIDMLIRKFSSVKLEFVKAAFENEFPRLLQLLNALGTKIEEGIENISIQASMRGVISNYEKAYLSKSLSRLFDAVNQSFVTVPSKAAMDNVIKIIKKEACVQDPILKKLVSRNINKTINLVSVKAEQLISHDGNATQVIGPATDTQMLNAQLLNALEYFKSELPESTESIFSVAQSCINPLVTAITDAVEAIILTLHNENFQRTSRATEYSLYMGELQSFLVRVSKDYMSLLDSTDLVQSCGNIIAKRTIDLFTRHICLLSSLGQESTRKQLSIDINHMEVVLTPICPVLSDLGKSYKLLKAFRTLLVLNMDEIPNSSLVGTVIPYSLAIHYLFRFANGEIRMPHTNNGWSITRYNKWLDKNPSESERLSLLKDTLESYVHAVKYKGLQEFVPVYPHMIALLQKGMLS